MATARNPLHGKVNRLVTSKLDDSLTRSALATVAELDLASGDSQLRVEVDARLARGSRDFLRALKKVNNSLNELQGHLDDMHATCTSVEGSLSAANQGTRYLLEHAEGLRSKRAATSQELALTQLFLARYTLSDDEVALIEDRDTVTGVSDELFKAMDRTEEIRDLCRGLLSDESSGALLEGQHQAGLDLMEYTANHLDLAYAKLSKFASFQLRGLSSSTPSEVTPLLRTSIRRLRARPDLLREVLALLTQTRSQALLDAFVAALTRGGPGGLPRPIEISAHDPVRYVGDMMAWIHQAMATEREFLESLFGVKDSGRWVGAPRLALPAEEEGEDGDWALGVGLSEAGEERMLRALLDRNMDLCARPLRLRVGQCVKSQEGTVVSYRVAALCEFYRGLMGSTFGRSGMWATVDEVMKGAYEAFFNTLRGQGRSLLRFIQPPSAALSPPPTLRDSLSTLRELMGVFSSSLLLDDTTTTIDPPSFTKVLDEALTPALEMCDKMSALRENEWDRWVFEVNCREAARATLEGGKTFCLERREEVEREMSERRGKIESRHFDNLIREAGLEGVLKALGETAQDSPLSHHPAASSAAISTALVSFSAFLGTLDTLSSPRLSLLPPRIASEIHAAALNRVSDAYGRVVEAVKESRNRYEGAETLLGRGRTVQEVAVLLGVQ